MSPTRSKPPAAGQAPAWNNQVRIIGGRFRRRLLSFPSRPGLRPTPDRVRETLFNWLGQRLDGLHCLDLFAGSGALGLEAASRGAARVVLVERDAAVLEHLRRAVAMLAASNVEVTRGDGLAYLAGDCGSFDLIFLDPPFDAGLLPAALGGAATHLAPGGKIYVEAGSDLELPDWHILRQGRAGLSHFYLLERA